MKQFDLTIFRQSRVLLIVLIFPVSALSALFIGRSITIPILNLLAPIIFLGLVGYGLYYYSIGHLTVRLNDKNLEFKWNKKACFNYNEIEPIEIEKINTLVIDQNQFLRKIIGQERTIKINNAKIQKKDSKKFIDFLRNNTNARVIDRWDIWDEKGWLKIAYRINTFLLTSFIGIVVVYTIFKGFNSRLLFFVSLVLSQLFLYHIQMKKKRTKN